MSEMSIDPGDQFPDLLAGDVVGSDVDLDFDSFEIEDDGISDE